MRRRSSSWANGELEVGHPTSQDTSITLSSSELHLIQRIRSLEAGAHQVFLVKDARGRDGLTKFRVRENIEDDTGRRR